MKRGRELGEKERGDRNRGARERKRAREMDEGRGREGK